MEGLRKYDKYLQKKYTASHYTSSEDLLMLNIIVGKLKSKYQVKSLRKLSRIINVSHNHLSQLLRGKIPLTQRTLVMLCFYTGISLNNLRQEIPTIDEYIDSKGNLIIEGAKCGNILK